MYQYKHTNGQVLSKVDFAVDSMGVWEYFDSPFVVAWWHIDDETKECDKNVDAWLKYGEKDWE